MILIVGAGGHGQVVSDIFRAARAAGVSGAVTAFIDDCAARLHQTYAGSTVRGPIADIAVLRHDAVIVAIGDNTVRARLFTRLADAGEQFAIARHPNSIIAVDAAIGDGTIVSAGAIVNTASVIGRNVIVNTAATIDHHCGDRRPRACRAGSAHGRRGSHRGRGVDRHRRDGPAARQGRRLEHGWRRRGGYQGRAGGNHGRWRARTHGLRKRDWLVR